MLRVLAWAMVASVSPSWVRAAPKRLTSSSLSDLDIETAAAVMDAAKVSGLTIKITSVYPMQKSRCSLLLKKEFGRPLAVRRRTILKIRPFW